MTRVDLHPEDLFDHLRDGGLRPEERERLDNHCARCSACAFELQLIQAEGENAEPDALDHAIAARAMERMLPAHLDRGADDRVDVHADNNELPIVLPVRGQGWFRAVGLLLAGVLAGGSVSAAALTGTTPFILIDVITAWVTPDDQPQSRQAAPTTTVTPTIRSSRITELPDDAHPLDVSPTLVEPAPPVADAPSETASPTSAPSPVAIAVKAERRDASASGATAIEQPVAPADPSTWLFRSASRARAAGRHLEAAALYGVLQRDYAGSETELVTRVALGRLWLGQLNDPGRALSAFDSYLVARPSDPLAEEARSGRVGALRKLGRHDDAQQAMDELLTHHPQTLYAAAPSTP
jgi:hypothetical protein